MPGFDGTGPLGQGPMTGRGLGFCVLTTSKENTGQVKGFAGLQSVPVGQIKENFQNAEKEVINMPFGDGTGPAGLGPMTGRAAGFWAGFPVSGYMNPIPGGFGYYVGSFGPYGARSYGYGTPHPAPYAGRFNPWIGRGFGFGFGRGFRFGRGFGRGRGCGRGRGRFGYWW